MGYILIPQLGGTLVIKTEKGKERNDNAVFSTKKKKIMLYITTTTIWYVDCIDTIPLSLSGENLMSFINYTSFINVICQIRVGRQPNKHT